MMDSQPISHAGNPGGLLVVLDSPNRQLWKMRKHFLPIEQRLVEATLKEAGQDLSKVAYTFAVPVYRDKIEPVDLMEWATWLRAEVEKLRPKKILCLGAAGYSILVNQVDKVGGGIAKITKIRGAMQLTPVEDTIYGETRWLPTIATVPQYFCLGEDADWFRDFAHDIHKLITRDMPEGEPNNELIIVQSVQELKNQLMRLSAAPVLSLDIETSGLLFKQNKIETIGIGALSKDRKKATCIIIPYNMLYTQDDTGAKVKALMRRFIQGTSFKGTIVLHNAKFDLKFIAEWIKEPITNRNIRDSLVLSYLLDERPINVKTSPHGLKTLARVRYDAHEYEFNWKSFWAKPPLDRDWQPLYKYLGLDLYYTLRVYFDMREEFTRTMPGAKFTYDELMSRSTLALTEMERQGAPINREYLTALRAELLGTLNETIQKMIECLHAAGIATDIFNPNSPKQVAAALFDTYKIPTFGERTTNQKHLDNIVYQLRGKTEYDEGMKFIELLLTYRHDKKFLSTYVDPLLEQAIQGVIFAQYNEAGASTGRMSSEKPNLTNIPQIKGTAIRRGFVAPHNHAWMKIDFSQLELRTSAHLSNDPVMLQAFRDDRDIHNEVASAMFGITADQVTKKQRYAAKFVDFGILYGRGASSLAYGPELREYGWSRDDAQKFIDNYLAQFSAMRDWMYTQRQRALSEQELVTPLGRKRRWPLILPDNSHHVERQALNFPIQSLASDITVWALVQIHEWLTENKMKARLVITVHDEIDLLVPWDEIDIVAKQAKYIMENCPPVPLNVPLKAEIEVGPNWGDLREYHEGFVCDWIEYPF